jgi:SAM-dependent methyltransferase
MEALIDRRGGFDLWRTRDGVRWYGVTRNGFGNPFNLGGRTMVSTPHGLFIGTANLFGPQVAVRRAAGWRFEPNPLGGAEVWLGSLAHRAALSPAPASDRFLGSLASPRRAASWDADDEDLENRLECLLDEHFEWSDYRHLGFWSPFIRSPRAACDNLVDEIAAFCDRPAPLRVPMPTTDEDERRYFESHGEGGGRMQPLPGPRRARVLELHCGRGATTRRLARHFAASGILAVTPYARDLEDCRRNLPEASFLRMSLPRLKLDPESFDVVICVEAMGLGGQPGVRRKLLEEAFRVLKPGGQLVGSDILSEVGEEGEPMKRSFWSVGGGSSPRDANDYARLLEAIGFVDLSIVDATEHCWTRGRQRALAFLEGKLLTLELEKKTFDAARSRFPGLGMDVGRYFLLSARKRGEAEGGRE